MREILFRGKRVEDGEWIEGDHERNGDIDVRINGWRVDPNTVGQFTGLFDKNGVRIFEGDKLFDRDIPTLVSRDDERFAVVEWDSDDGCFVGNFRTLCHEMACWRFKDCKVIGNIFDNGGLIQGAP